MTTTRDIINSVITSNGVGGINGASLRGLLDSLIVFETLAAVATSTFRSDINQILTLGYSVPGDGGGSVYIRSASVPPHSLYIQAADGSYWVYPPGLSINFIACGAVGDGVIGNYSVGTDNTLAMAKAGSYAKAESAAGRGVRWDIPSGVYNYDIYSGGGGVGCADCLINIKLLHMVGYGATFQPTSMTYFARQWPVAYDYGWGAFQAGQADGILIQPTAVGDYKVTCINPLDAAGFSIGVTYLVMSDDIQYGGYPPSVGQFEYVKVTATDSTSGIVSLDRAIRWIHSPNFPEGAGYGDMGVAPYGSTFVGKARIWKLSHPGHDWDVEHVYEGFSVLNTRLSIFNDGDPSRNYQPATGRFITWLNAPKINGISPTSCERAVYENCGLLTSPEPDKLVDELILNEVHGSNIAFQSPLNRVTFIRCRFDFVLTGPPKIFTIDQCDIGQLTNAITYGANSRTTVRNSFIRSFSSAPWGLGTLTTTVDGTNVKYGANGVGVFTVSKAISPAYYFIYWNVIPGMWIKIPSQFGFNDLGIGIIQNVTEDASNFYIHTTLSYPSWPSWAPALPTAVAFWRLGTHRYYNCTGCDLARKMSKATEMGLEPWELTHQLIYGNPNSIEVRTEGQSGVLKELTIEVVHASTVASTMVFGIYFTPYNNPVTQYTTTMWINLAIRGKRTFTSTNRTGLQSGDTWHIDGGAEITAIPADMCIAASAGCTATGNSLVEITSKWDNGIWGKPIIGAYTGTLTPPI
jgi:hypothetical protein